MADENPTADPWSDDGLAFRRVWPVVAAGGGGAAYAVIWVALGRPDVHLLRWAVWLSFGAGVVSAAIGPPARRLDRFATCAMVGFVASSAATVVAAAIDGLDGDSSFTGSRAPVVVSVITLVVFGGGALMIAAFQRPRRRLPDEMLRAIPPPAATRRTLREVDVVLDDGSTQTIRLMKGGFVAIRPSVDVDRIAGLAEPVRAPRADAVAPGEPSERPPLEASHRDAPVVSLVLRHPELRAQVGSPRVLCSGATIGEVLSDLRRRHPGSAAVVDAQGSLDPDLIVYLGDPNRTRVPDKYTVDPSSTVEDGDVLTIERRVTS